MSKNIEFHAPDSVTPGDTLAFTGLFYEYGCFPAKPHPIVENTQVLRIFVHRFRTFSSFCLTKRVLLFIISLVK